MLQPCGVWPGWDCPAYAAAHGAPTPAHIQNKEIQNKEERSLREEPKNMDQVNKSMEVNNVHSIQHLQLITKDRLQFRAHEQENFHAHAHHLNGGQK
jgi:hypothetical protein